MEKDGQKRSGGSRLAKGDITVDVGNKENQASGGLVDEPLDQIEEAGASLGEFAGGKVAAGSSRKMG